MKERYANAKTTTTTKSDNRWHRQGQLSNLRCNSRLFGSVIASTNHAETHCNHPSRSCFLAKKKKLIAVVHARAEDGTPSLTAQIPFGADLSVDGAGVYSGSFSYLQSYIDSASVGYGKVKKGSASLTEPRMATKVHFHGKDAEDDIYKAHLHDDTCENGGGGHYNGGDGVTVDAVNENWPEVTCMDGKCNGMAWSGWHPAAGDVFSIVVHDTPAAATGSGAKMLCADLMWDSKGQSYWGNFEYLQPYIDSAAPGVGAISHDSASLTAYNMGSSSGTGTGKGGKKGKGGGKKGKKAGLLAHQSQAATFGITAGGTIALVGVIGLVALVATKTLGAKPVPETEGLLEYIVPEAVEL